MPKATTPGTTPGITPGSKINVKVIKTPTNAAATKTLVRLLSKDRSVKAENERHRKIRRKHESDHQRGGRMWTVRVVKQPAVRAIRGQSKTIVASLDVLTDLKSVSRFVEVTPA